MRKLFRLGLVPKFALLSLVLITALGVVLARSISSDVRSRNLDNAKKVASTVMRLGVQPELTHEMLTDGLTRADIARLDGALRQAKSGISISRMKVWNPQGEVVYSDEHRLIGKRFEIDDDLKEALAGDSVADVSDLVDAENRYDRALGGQLLEVYVPLQLTGYLEPSGVFELYLPYAPIAATIHDDTWNLSLLLAGGLALLWLVLFRIVWGASRRLRKQANENRHQALHDSLTNLPNRVLFQDRVSHAIAQADRNQTGLAVMLMDLDRFKEVNDTLGHHSGDLLLQAIGPRLASMVRASDTVARLGGDEFAVLLPGIDDGPDALAIGEKLLRSLETPFALDALTVDVEASIGIALYPYHGDDATSLLQHADVAMYRAKDTHSGVELYRSEHDSYSRDRLSLVADLRRALELGEIVMHYQPKVDLQTGTVRGTEALLRWQHPTRGLLAPDAFLPAAERTGLIRPLTLHVLDLAVAQCREWRAHGYDLTVAVNLSARNLHDLSLPDEIARVLTRWNLPAEALELEITESAIMADPVRALDIAQRLHELGIRLSIDDFGTGYSSLSYLRQFPVDEIKIDKSFVIDMSRDENDAAIVRSTIGLGHNLGLLVVAEGVEDHDVHRRLVELGCDLAQGYLLCRPMRAAALRRWLDERARDRLVLAPTPA